MPTGDLLPGVYVAEDIYAAQLMFSAKRGSCKLEPYVAADCDATPSSALWIRPGAFGDLLLLTPALRAFREKNPLASVSLACMPQYAPIVASAGFDRIIDYPVSAEDIARFGSVFCLENVIEGNANADTAHAADIFADRVGVKLHDRTPVYEISQVEKDWSKARYPRTALKRVAIHVSASTQYRNYPQHHVVKVLLELAKRGIEVFLIGAPMQWRAESKGVIRNLMLESLDIRQSVAAMATCDVLVAPDSVMLHVAAAIGMQAIGLYGPIHWSNRISGTTVEGIQGNTGCKPCYHNIGPNEGNFPAHCPTAAKGYCGLMESIAPERVVSKVQLLLK